MRLMNDEVANQLRTLFNDIKTDVTIAFFTSEGECVSCEETHSLLHEVEELSDKIHLAHYDIDKDYELAKAYNIEMVPSFVLLDHEGKNHGVKFNGIPAGHEINSFIPAILDMGNAHEEEVPKEYLERINAISKPVNIKVFVTLSCPHCPGAVQKAHKLAMLNSNIEGEMVEAQTFYELSNRFNVSSVPKIVINDSVELVGNQPFDAFLEAIEQLP
jgi:glutaredoxin-like protein